MSITESSKPCHIKLRDIRIPEDYEHIATLLNMVEPGSTTAQTLAEEDSQIPTTSNLTLNEEGLLIGFGRTRVIAENDHGQVIGYGAVFRAPWVDAGNVGSIFCAHPDYSGQGVGERILVHLENWAKEQQASVLTSVIMDWIDASLPFVQKRGYSLDAHVFDLELDVHQFDFAKYASLVEQVTKSGIQFVTLAETISDDTERKLYELWVDTSKDNPGQYGSVAPFDQWKKEFMPENFSRKDWVFIAVDGERFVGVTQLFTTEEEGVVYTNYTGVHKEYRGRDIAKALKALSIETARKAGAQTMTTDSEKSNAPIQHLNRTFGYIPGKGHYRILKRLRD